MTMRGLPAVHRVLAEPSLAAYARVLGVTAVKDATNDVLAALRATVSRDPNGAVPPFDRIVASVAQRLSSAYDEGLVPVINGTGILLHTNLGRAPLGVAALTAMSDIARDYSNLEYDLEAGTRGSRYARLTSLLRGATGAEDAVVVNNCAAALLLVLDTFGREREVVVGRNQLIEIGGGFRLPDVLRRSGATLVETGSTNRVYLQDFERALGPRTALVLRSHPSNYRIEGFVADVAPGDLAALAKRAGVLAVEDLGSGALVDLVPYGLPHERTVAEAVADGFDLVTFSGDKLLGGPQAGIIVGKTAHIARLRANPLIRALRVDNVTLAALGATLHAHTTPEGRAKIPFYAMLLRPLAELRERAERLAAECTGPRVTIGAVPTQAYAGGGALPAAALPSYGVALEPVDGNPNALAATLRRMPRPLVARVEGRAVIVDLRTIDPRHDVLLGPMLSTVSI